MPIPNRQGNQTSIDNILNALSTTQRPPMTPRVQQALAVPQVNTGTEANLQDLPLEIQAMINQAMGQINGTAPLQEATPQAAPAPESAPAAAVDPKIALIQRLMDASGSNYQSVQQYKAAAQKSGQVPSFTNIPGQTKDSMYIPNEYGDNINVIGSGAPEMTIDTLMPELSARAIDDFVPQGETDTDKYNDLKRFLAESQGLLRNAVVNYSEGLRDPSVATLTEVGSKYLKAKMGEDYNQVQQALTALETKRVADFNMGKNKLFSNHMNALTKQQTELSILEDKHKIALTGAAQMATYKQKQGLATAQQQATADTMTKLTGDNINTINSQILAGTANPGIMGFANDINSKKLNFHDVVMEGATPYKDVATGKDGVLSLERKASMYNTMVRSEEKDSAKADLKININNSSLAAYKKGISTFSAETMMDDPNFALLGEKGKAMSINSAKQSAGLVAMMQVGKSHVTGMARSNMDKIIPDDTLSLASRGSEIRAAGLTTLKAYMVEFLNGDTALDIPKASRLASEKARFEETSSLKGASSGEVDLLLNDLKQIMLGQLIELYSGTGITPSELDLGTMGGTSLFEDIMSPLNTLRPRRL